MHRRPMNAADSVALRLKIRCNLTLASGWRRPRPFVRWNVARGRVRTVNARYLDGEYASSSLASGTLN